MIRLSCNRGGAGLGGPGKVQSFTVPQCEHCLLDLGIRGYEYGIYSYSSVLSRSIADKAGGTSVFFVSVGDYFCCVYIGVVSVVGNGIP